MVFSLFGWLIEASVESHFTAEDIAEIDFIADRIRKNLDALTHPNAAKPVIDQQIDDILTGHHDAQLLLIRADGSVIYRNSEGPDLTRYTHLAIDTLTQVEGEQHQYRLLRRRMGDAFVAVIAVSMDEHYRFDRRFHRVLWLMIASSIALMAFISFAAVHFGHKPLRRVIDRMQRINTDRLDARIDSNLVPKELNDLVVSFNELLQRLEKSFRQLSNYSDDIAHELRTPITSLLTQSQVALSQQRSVEEYREILYSNIEEYERIAEMIKDMLFLAKTENGMYQLDLVQLDLKQEIAGLLDYYEAWAEERDITLRLSGNATLQGDRAMIRRAIGNLISNAVKHTPNGNTVSISLEQSRSHALIHVSNPGPPVANEHLPHLFNRFYRVANAGSAEEDGVGLGLAITQSIVHMHHGSIKVESNQQATTFSLRLPA